MIKTLEPEIPVSLWRNVDFVALWSGQFISFFGSKVSNLALPLLVLAITHSAAQAGFIASARMVPYLLFGLPAGALIDQWNRKTVMIVCDGIRAGALGLVPLAYATGHLGLTLLYVVSFVQGTAFVFFNVAEVSSLPHVVPKAQIAEAIGLDSAAGSAGSLVGPALCGWIIALARTTPAGAALAYLLDAATYVISVLTLGLIRVPFQAERKVVRVPLRQGIASGLRFVWADRPLRFLALLSGALALLYAPLSLAMIVLARDQLHASARTIGLIFSVSAIGGLIGAYLAPKIKARFRVGQIILGAALVQALATPLIGLATSAAMMATGWTIAFLMDPLLFAASSAYRLSVTPDPMQGRMNSIFRLLSYGAEPLGAAVGGYALGIVGPRVEIVAVAVAVGLCALAVSCTEVRRL